MPFYYSPAASRYAKRWRGTALAATARSGARKMSRGYGRGNVIAKLNYRSRDGTISGVPRTAYGAPVHYNDIVFNENATVDTTAGFTGYTVGGFELRPSVSIAKGSGVQERVGSKIYFKKLEVRLRVAFTPVDPALTTTMVMPDEPVRILIVQDKQANGTVAAITDVLDNTESDGSAVLGGPYARLKIENTKRFDILFDKTYNIPAVKVESDEGTGKITTESGVFVNLDLTLKGRTQMYTETDTSGIASNIMTGTLYIFVSPLNTSNGARKASYSIIGGSRLYFTEA